MNNCLADVQAFLRLKRIAFVGISRTESDFSRTLWRELERRGYDLVPVNPMAGTLEGRRCYARVQEITPPVEGVLVMTKAGLTSQVLADCREAGVQAVWLYRASGSGSVDPVAVKAAREQRMCVVAGECPMMFLDDAGWFHRVHGWLRKVCGVYPAAGQSGAPPSCVA